MTTPGQTVGPFFGVALPYAGDSELVPPGAPGCVRLAGRVLDGRGEPVPDALVEIRQADPAGRVPLEPGSLARDGVTFTGWGRAPTDRTGHYRFCTLTPGAVDGGAPFFAVCVVARGLLDRLLTRAYLPEDSGALDRDPLLRRLPAARRSTLLARRDEHGYLFDVVLQGPDETVFLRAADGG